MKETGGAHSLGKRRRPDSGQERYWAPRENFEQEMIQRLGDNMRDLSYSQRVLRQAELMDRMMGRLRVSRPFASGIDGGLAWYEACTKCIFCTNAKQCCDWLEGSERLTGPAEFCPNTEFFQGCFSEIFRCRGVVPTD